MIMMMMMMIMNDDVKKIPIEANTLWRHFTKLRNLSCNRIEGDILTGK